MKSRLWALLLVFTFSAAHAEFAPAIDRDGIARPAFFSMITNIPGDLKSWSDDTFRYENVPSILGILGLTGMMVMTDFETWQAVRVRYYEDIQFRRAMDAGEKFSQMYLQVGSGLAFVAGGLLTGSNRAVRTGYQVFQGILSSGVVVQLIKHTTARESPFKSSMRTGRWRVFPNQREYMQNVQAYDAMPSGHLSSAAIALFVIQENYPEWTWLPYVTYPLLGWVTVSLVGTNIHWWSDFPISFALAYGFSKTVTRSNHLPKARENGWRPLIYPTFSQDGDTMLAAAWQW